MIDSVMVPCPNCGRKGEFQTKAGECAMNVYSLETAPSYLILDVLNQPEFCHGCRRWFAIVDPAIPPGTMPRPNAAPVLLKPIPETSEQLSKAQYYWPYDKPFTFDDLEPAAHLQRTQGESRAKETPDAE